MSNLFGDAESNILGGTSNDDLINGYGGNDELSGGGGNDLLNGGADADTLKGGGGIDTLNGDAGVDTLKGGGGNDTLNGGADNDTLAGGKGSDTLDGGEGNDRYEVTAKDAGTTDTFNDTGTSGEDVIDADKVLELMLGSEFDSRSGIESILGDVEDLLEIISDGHAVNWDFTGIDLVNVRQITGSGENDVITGSDGDDKVKGGAGDDALDGGLGNDNLTGGGGVDEIQGGDGNDKLKGGGGNDTLDGGEGSDTYLYKAGEILDDDIVDTGSTGTDVVDVHASAVMVLADDFDTTGSGIEVIVGNHDTGTVLQAGEHAVDWNFGGVTLEHIKEITGSGAGDLITGSESDDRIKSGGGDDDVSGGAGNDNLAGGGNDDHLAGDEGNDLLKGGGGDDTLAGGTGNDTLKGGGGNDTLRYDADDGLVDGQDGTDELSLDDVTGVTLDITGLAGTTLKNLETIDLANGGNTLVLDKNSVRDLSGTTNILTVNGGSMDSIMTTGDLWNRLDDEGTYYVFQSGLIPNHMVLRVLNEISIGFIDTPSNELPVLQVNTGVQLDEGETITITASMLSAADVDSPVGAVNYRVAVLPAHGTLFNNGVEIGINVSFTQEDVDAGLVTYVSTADDATSDMFEFQLENNDSNTDGIFEFIINATLEGTGDADELTGGAGDDVLSGFYGDDFLSGGAGDDILDGGPGNDDLDGGPGTDTVDYSTTLGSVFVDLAGNETVETDFNSTDFLTDIENVVGGAGQDNIFGNGGNNLLIGAGGADTLVGRAGNDTLHGGALTDELSGGAGNDTLDGGSGVDTAKYDLALSDLVIDLDAGTATGDGDDILISIENVFGGSGNDVIIGDEVRNEIFGGGGNDTLYGGGGDDLLSGQTGEDVLYGGAGDDVYQLTGDVLQVIVEFENEGTDSVSVGSDELSGQSYTLADNVENADFGGGSGAFTLIGNGGDNQLTGGTGNDVLLGMDGSDTLFGADGDDTLDGGAESDSLDGGEGVDTASYVGMVTNVVVKLGGGPNGDDLVFNVENAIGGSGDDFIQGSFLANTLAGSGGDDTLHGGQEKDLLMGGAGDDILDGQDDIDTVSYQADEVRTIGVYVDLAYGYGGTWGGDENDTLSNIEKVIGTAYGDHIIGDGANNTLFGGSGNDQLFGGAGDDLFVGEALNGGPLGDDAMDGGDGVDTVSYEQDGARTVGVYVDLANGYGGAWGGDENDTLSNIEKVIGTAFDDYIIGDGADNILHGGAGNDRLHGGAGNDVFIGGAGNDHFYGESGSGDTVDYSYLTESVTIDLNSGSAFIGATEEDAFIDIENAVGGAFADEIVGDGADNSLSGGGGNDTLVGAGGNDTLEGGTGDDVFRFHSGASGGEVDVILDFEGAGSTSGDIIEIDRSVFTGLTTTSGVLSAAEFAHGEGMNIATTAEVRIFYDDITGFLYYDADGSGGTFDAVHFATLDAQVLYSHEDFFVLSGA